MKVGGIEYDKSKALSEPYVIRQGTLPSGEPRLLAFIAQTVWELSDFHARCPLPEAPPQAIKFKSNGKKEIDGDHPAYQDMLRQHSRKRWGYIILKSLEPSDIEFDTLSLDDPETWGNVESELRRELGYYEFGRIMTMVDCVNNIDEDMLEENRQSFFRQNAPAKDTVGSQPVEPVSSQS